jgi:hypothetical protein
MTLDSGAKTAPNCICQFWWWYASVYKGCWQLVDKFSLNMELHVISVSYRFMYLITCFHDT